MSIIAPELEVDRAQDDAGFSDVPGPEAPPDLLAHLPVVIALTLSISLIGCCTYALASGAFNSSAASPLPSGFPNWLRIVLAVMTVLAGGRWCTMFLLAYLSSCKLRRERAPEPEEWPLVSILVPAYNESETIAPALRSLLQQDYPLFEVIVIDDGSRDDTCARARPFAGEHARCSLEVISKPNGGKWSALNCGFARSRGQFILCVDADSRLSSDALRRLVRRMHDPRVHAVAGQVRVRNRINLLTRLQALEYIMANGLVRLAQSLTGTVLVVPGPIALFRRDALERITRRFASPADHPSDGSSIGPFEGDTFAEDFDLSVAILSLGGQAVYEPGAISFTKSPDWSHSLLNQRYRWCRGTIQVLRKYLARARAHPELRKPWLMAWLGMTYFLELMVLPIFSVLLLAIVISVLVAGGSGATLFIWAAAFFVINLNAAAFFLAVHDEELSLLAAFPFYDLYHSFLLNSGWLIAVLDEIRGCKMRW